MRIGINTRFLLPGKMEGFGWYTFEVTKRLVEQNPAHEFIFFFDRKFDQKFIFGKNVEAVILTPPARHPILFILWFEFLLPKALKRHKIDVLFTPDGYVSLRSKIPQVATIHDINFEHFPKDIPQPARSYLRYFFPRFAKKASHILTVSDYSKQDISSSYNIDPAKISVAWNGVSEVFHPLKDPEKINIQNKYSNGKPFFLFVGSIHPRKNVPRLLKAFEKYSLDPTNDWNLVIVGEAMWGGNSHMFENNELIKNNRILFSGHLSQEELANVVGAASTLTFVPYFEGFGLPLVEAMKCGVPILSGNLTSLPEVAGNSAIYCDPFDVDSISEGMILLSKDTSLRDQLKQNGIERSKLFNWDNSAKIVWEAILKANQENQ